MALDTKDKRLAVISWSAPHNPTLPDPDNSIDVNDRAHLLGIVRNIQESLLTEAKRLAFMQLGVYHVMTLPSPDGSLDLSDRRHMLSITRFEGDQVLIPSTNLTYSSEAPTIDTKNTVIFIPTGQLTFSSRLPVLVRNWVANNWWNPFWVLPLADFSSRQGGWWGPVDVNSSVEIDTGQLTLASESPALLLEGGAEIVIPTAQLTMTTEAPSLLLGEHRLVYIPTRELDLSTAAPVVYYELPTVIIIPTAQFSMSMEAPGEAYHPDHQFLPASSSLAFSSDPPTVLTVLSELEIPTGQLTLSSEAMTPSVPSRRLDFSDGTAGGSYRAGRAFTPPPPLKKKRPLPDEPGIAATHVGDKVLISRPPQAKVSSPPITLSDTLRLLQKMDNSLSEANQHVTAEIRSFKEAMDARERKKERESRETQIKQLVQEKERLEKELAENHKLMAALLLLMVE